MGAFLSNVLGNVTKQIEKRHAEEEQKKVAQREDLWKIISAPPGTFSEQTQQQALADWQKGLNPEAKKAAGKFGQIFEKLKPALHPQQQGQPQQPQQGAQPQPQGQPAQPNIATPPFVAPSPRGQMQPPQPVQQSAAAPAQQRGPLQPPQPPSTTQTPAGSPSAQPGGFQMADRDAIAKKAEQLKETAEIFKGDQEVRVANEKRRAEESDKEQAQQKQESAALAYAATLPESEQSEFKKFLENKKFLGTPNPEHTATQEDVKNIPGSALKGQKDAFGNAVDEKTVYTKSKDGKLYPEAPAPKADSPEAGEVRERAKAYQDKGMPEAQALQKARQDWVKEQDNKAKGVQVRIDNASSTGANAKPTMSDEEMRALAKYQIQTGEKPSFGLSANNPDRKRYNAIIAQELVNDPESAAARAAYKAGTANLAQLTKMRGSVSSFEDAFKADLTNAEDAAKNVSRSSAKLFNRWSQLASADLTDNPDLAAFRVATQTAINQYARLMFSATGGGTSTDSARGDAESLLNTAMASGTYDAALKQMRKEVVNRVKGLDDEIAAQRKQMSSPSPKGKLNAPDDNKDPLGILK